MDIRMDKNRLIIALPQLSTLIVVDIEQDMKPDADERRREVRATGFRLAARLVEPEIRDALRRAGGGREDTHLVVAAADELIGDVLKRVRPEGKRGLVLAVEDSTQSSGYQFLRVTRGR